MCTFTRIRCYRKETADVVVASCFGLPGKRKVHHSPTGYEWGYGGSGPADLALNILARVRPHSGLRNGAVLLGDGSRVSDAAWNLHQHLKWELIAGLPRHGFTVSRQDIQNWINTADTGERRDLCRRIIEREEMHALADSAGVTW